MSTDTSKSLFDQAMKEILSSNFVRAEHLLQQASEVNEENTTLYAASWAVLLALRNREEEAISILEERLSSHSTDTHLLLAYGITLEKQENWDDAEDAFREVISQDPDNPGALRGLSSLLARKKGDPVEVATLAVRAFSQAPDNAIFAKTAANMLEAIDQPKTALEILDLAALYNPEDEELVSRALKGCLANNLIDRAREILSILDINMPWAAGWKASFLDWQGEKEKADELIERTLSRPAGRDPEFLFQAACIAMRREDFDTAELYVERILEQDPQHTGALRIRADLSLGRTDLDGAIDPLMKAFSLSSDNVTGWRLFWSCIASGRFEAADETLTTLSEDESLMADILEVARLELAGLFLDSARNKKLDPKALPSLDLMPNEASCGLLLEFLEATEEFQNLTSNLAPLSKLLYQELGHRDPLLRLNRLYARNSWELMQDALEDLMASIEDGEPALGFDQTSGVHSLYSLLTALATQNQDRVATLTTEVSPETAATVTNILHQKLQPNPTEKRWLYRGDSEDAHFHDHGTLDSTPLETTPTGVNIDVRTRLAGAYIDEQDVEVIYETEDGQLLTDLSSGNYEVIDESEIDPDDPDYEYIWVEEEVTSDDT